MHDLSGQQQMYVAQSSQCVFHVCCGALSCFVLSEMFVTDFRAENGWILYCFCLFSRPFKSANNEGVLNQFFVLSSDKHKRGNHLTGLKMFSFLVCVCVCVLFVVFFLCVCVCVCVCVCLHCN